VLPAWRLGFASGSMRVGRPPRGPHVVAAACDVTHRVRASWRADL
jgi:hypothetical protein